MSKLIEYRDRIDEIDSKIIALYEERMDIVKDVVAYKIKNNMPVSDVTREAKMLEKNLKRISNQLYKKYYKEVLDGYLKASKDMQCDIVKENHNDVD